MSVSYPAPEAPPGMKCHKCGGKRMIVAVIFDDGMQKLYCRDCGEPASYMPEKGKAGVRCEETKG